METTIHVAIPALLVDAISSPHRGAEVDLTALIEEWAVGFLRPADALAAAAPRVLGAELWPLRGRATVTPPIVRLLRDAAELPGVLDAIAASGCSFVVDTGALRAEGVCLLAGIAAVIALEAEIGGESRRLKGEARRRAAARSARQRSDAQAAAAPMPPRDTA